MGQKYTSQSQSGYNSNPPPDDGSTGSNNLITWANTKTKIGDPLLNLAQNMNSALVNALDFGSRTTGINDTASASDHMKSIECTATITETLPTAASVGPGYTVTIKNTSISGTVTVALQTGTDSLDGTVGGTTTITTGSSTIYKVNSAGNGYFSVAAFFSGGVFRASGVQQYTGTSSLTSSDFGRIAYYNSASAGNLTLPSPTGNAGKLIAISNIIGTGIATILRNSADVIYAQGWNGAASITLNPSESIILTTDGTNWIQVSYTASKSPHSAIFTTNGTWTAPAGVTQVKLSGCSPGGGGASVSGTQGGGGGAAGCPFVYGSLVSVTPGTGYAVSVAGGAAGTAGVISLGAVFSLTGGVGGSGGGGGTTSNGYTTTVAGGNGGNSANGNAGGSGFFPGGAAGAASGAQGGGGGGGGSMYAPGGNGGNGQSGVNPGGGGGGAGYVPGSAGGLGTGGAGGAGLLVIEW